MTRRYTVRVEKQVRKVLEKLQRDPVGQRIADAIKALADDPRPEGSTKLQGGDDLHRVRVGSYRIVYAIQDAELLVLVVRVGHRGDVYRRR